MKNLLGDEIAPIRDRYVDMWNRLPTSFKHRKPSTEVYKQATQFFFQLENGTFWQGKVIDKEWADKLGVDKGKRWKKAEIFQGLRRLALMYQIGNWPSNKKHLPRRLPDLLYNPATNKSLFITVMLMKQRPARSSWKGEAKIVSDYFTI